MNMKPVLLTVGTLLAITAVEASAQQRYIARPGPYAVPRPLPMPQMQQQYIVRPGPYTVPRPLPQPRMRVLKCRPLSAVGRYCWYE